MKFIKFVKVDHIDRIPETEFPARHGPDDPLPNITHLWLEAGTPTVYYGSIKGKVDENTQGILATYTAADFEPILEARINNEAYEKRADLDNARDAAFEAGMPYLFPDGDDVVQTRQQDQLNLLAIMMEAQSKLALGSDEPVVFRALSNTVHSMTPQQAVEMALAALDHIRGVYNASWAAKDVLDTVTSSPVSLDVLGNIRGVAFTLEGLADE